MVRGVLLLCATVLLASCAQPPQTKTSNDSISLAVSYDPENLDPHSQDTISSIAISSNFYEGLVKVDGNLRTEAGLADLWESPDATTWIFHLRPGVKFHSGKPLTSEDVVYSFERVRKDPSLEMSVYIRNIVSVHEKGPRRVEIKTQRASSIFLNKIRMIHIIPAGTRSEDIQSAANGTGPYRLLNWKPHSYIQMIRNEDYWGEKPFVREATFHLRHSPQEALASFRAGQSRFVQCNSRKLDAVSKEFPDAEALRSDSLFVNYMGFNLSNPSVENPFRNLAFRQAIHIALDRKKLVADLSSYAVPAVELVPVFVFGYNPKISLPEQNPKRIAELLKEAAWKPDSTTVMHVREPYYEAGSLVQRQLQAAGISMRLEVLRDDQFFELRQKGQVLSFISRYGCTSGDASDLVEDVFHSPDRAGLYDGIDPGRYMHASSNSIETDKEMPNVMDFRRQGLQSVMALFMDDLLMAPLFVEQDAYLIDKSYKWKPRYDSVISVAEIHPASQ